MERIKKISLSVLTLILVLSMLANIPSVSSVQGPRTEDLIIRFYSDVQSTYAALKADEIDLVAYTGWSVGLPLHDGKQSTADLLVDATSDVNIVLAPLPGNDIVGFDFNSNCTISTYPGIQSPMTYKSFRQALAFLVDKDWIVDVAKGGFASKIDVPIPYPQSGWWNSNVTGVNYPYAYNLLTAASYLDTDGFAQGATPNPYYDPAFPGSAMYIRTYPPGHSKAGQDLDPLIFYVRTDDSARLQAGRHLYSNMRKHGIPVNPVEATKQALYDPVMGMRDFHIYTSGWVVKKWPIYLYQLYHRDFWYPYGANYVTGLNCTGGPNYPQLDHELEQLWFNDNYAGSISACNRAQQIMVDECISVWLYSSLSYVPYTAKLLGIVNMDGYGPINKYTFMNAYKTDGTAIRVGLVNPPISLNVMYSDWIYDWIGLDRIYSHLMNEAPYNLAVDQPWLAQDWYIDTWVDPQDGETKTRVTYWLRENVSWVQPVTGDWDGWVTAHDVEFSIWYNYAYNDAWHWNDVADVHHTRIVDDHCIEVYFNVSTYWGVYWIGEQLPIIPKHLWLTNFCEERDATVILDRDYAPCEKFMFTEDAIVQTVEVWLDGTPLTESVDYNIVAKNGCHNWFHWLIPAYTGQNLTVRYWTPFMDPHGYTPGNYPWQDKLEGSGMYYVTAHTPGVGGSLTLKRNPHYWLETPVLGDIDFLWSWSGYDESRRIDPNRAPRHGCYEVTAFDVVLVSGASGSQGTGVPSSNWFPGADVAPDGFGRGGTIDIFDVVTVTGAFGRGEKWGCTRPLEHDVAVIDIATSKTGCLPMETAGQGFNVSVYVTVENQGDSTETFTVTAYANVNIIGTQPVTLNAGDNQILTYIWNTTSFAKGNYTISATADTVPGETDTSDNTYVNNDEPVFVTVPGDVDGDRDVDIYDIVRMAGIYGVSKPDPEYDPNCDIDGDGDIDIYDIVAAAGNYGESW